jgi:hypothetical protein
MSKKIFIIGIAAFVILCILAVLIFFNAKPLSEKSLCSQEAKICSDGSAVARTGPHCEFALCPGEQEGILVFEPKRNEVIKSPLAIKGKAKGQWFFEGEFYAELYDEKNNFLGRTILTAKEDWMSADFVSFEGELVFNRSGFSLGNLKFFSSNPSGLAEYQRIFEVPVQFEKTPQKEVLLFYYNAQKDKDETGNIKCSRDGLVAVKRTIPFSQTPIQDTIKLLLKGKENLTVQEMKEGISTEYPLEGFSLKGASLKDGVLTLEFEDKQHKTGGGSCRVGILWFQIEQTAKQFPEVKEVRFLPEELFQP